MRYTLTILLAFIAMGASAQDRFTRIYNQDTSFTSGYTLGICPTIQTTSDGGHLLQYIPAIESEGAAGGLPIVIKTDSNFYPQWRQYYIGSPLCLASGILNCYAPFHIDTLLTFQKTDLNGTSLWMKVMTDDSGGLLYLATPVNNNSKIRYIGSRNTHTLYTPMFMDIDTLGNFIAADTIIGDTTSFENQFSDDSGNYFFLQTGLLGGGDRKITKLHPDNSIAWSYVLHKYFPYDITSMVALANGDVIFGGSYGSSTDSVAILLIKFSATGQLIWQKSADRQGNLGAMQLLPNGNIILSAAGNSFNAVALSYKSDVIEIDTAANVIWAKDIAPDVTGASEYMAQSAPYIRSNNDWYFTAIKRDPYAPIVYNTDSMGVGHCTSTPIAYSFADSSLFTLIPTTLNFAPFTVTVSTLTPIDSTLPQLFIDSCDYATPASVTNTTIHPDINIYPNPASNTFSIQNTGNISSVEIFDMAGRLVSSVAENSSFDKIDISRLKDGYYIIRLIRKDNNIIYKKLVVIN